jgi:transcriptional regulator with XRE-family HTH domain
MSNIGNKKTMSENLSYYVELSGKTQKELSEIVGVAYSTFNDWMNGKKYPRIDKIEMLANYFGILKSDLIEERTENFEEREEMKKKNDILSDIVIKMRIDPAFCSLIESLYSRNDSEIMELMKTLLSLDDDKIRGVKQMLTAFLK